MANTITSPNMSLPLPVPGVDLGPDYALNNNSAFLTIDGHDHSAGKGVQVTPAGLNINADLTFLNTNNAIDLRSVRFTSQSAVITEPDDLDCLYTVGVDLFYNDGNGNNVRITQSGGVAGTPGSIANLTPPASASYVSGNETFVWESAANTPANMDAASYIFRNLVANSKGLTLNPPAAMGADFALTLPNIPSVTSIMALDNSGAMSAPYTVDSSTIVINAGVIEVPTGGITSTQLAANSVITSKIADGDVTRPKLVAVGQQISTTIGNFTTSSTTPVDVTGLSITITTTGRPVFLALISNTSGLAAIETTTNHSLDIFVVRDSTTIANYFMGGGNAGTAYGIPSSSVFTVDVVAAGTYTYKIQLQVTDGPGSASITGCALIAYEL